MSRARDTYERAERAGRKAVVMEVDDGEVELRVGNAPAAAVQEVRIRYVEELESTFGAARYRYTMPWDREGTFRAAEFSVEVRAPGLSADEFEAYGYDVGIEPNASGIVARFEAKDFLPVGDFVAVARPRGNAHLVQEKRDGEAFMALTVRPEIPAIRRSEEADFIVVLDASASRSDRHSADTKFVRSFLETLRGDARALVVVCNDRCRPLGPKKFERPQDVLAAIEGQPPVDYARSTNILEVARFGRSIFENLGTDRERRMVYVTDAVATAGPLDPRRKFEEHVVAARMAVDVVGDAPRSSLGPHARLASAGHGTYIQRTEPDATATAILENSQYHVLSGISVEADARFTAIHPRGILPLRRGESFTVLARMNGGKAPKTVHVTGVVGDTEYDEEFEVSASTLDRPVASSAWAHAEVKHLEARGAQRKEIIEVATRYSVPSKATAFIAVAPEPSVSTLRADRMPPSAEVIQEKRKIRQRRKPARKRDNELEIISGTSLFGGGSSGGWKHRRPHRERPPLERIDFVVLDPGSDARFARRWAQHAENINNVCVAEHADEIWRRGEIKLAVTYSPGMDPGVELLSNRLGTEAFGKCLVELIESDPAGYAGDKQLTFEIGVRMNILGEQVEDSGEAKETERASADTVTLTQGVYTPDVFERAFAAREHRSEKARLTRRMVSGVVNGADDTSFEARVFLRELPNWLEEVAGQVELGPTRARLMQAAGVERNAARACAYMQAVDSVDGADVRPCPGTSDLKWLGVNPQSPTPKPKFDNPKLSVLFASTDPNRRLMLVRIDGERFWWIEEGEAARCELDSRRKLGELRIREECVFSDLPDGVYGLMLAPSKYGEERAPARFAVSFAGEEERVEWDGESLVAATVVVGTPKVSAPEVRVRRFKGKPDTASLWESLRPALNFCLLGRSDAASGLAASPAPARVSFTVSPGENGELKLDEATGLSPAEKGCLAPYLNGETVEGAETVTVTL